MTFGRENESSHPDPVEVVEIAHQEAREAYGNLIGELGAIDVVLVDSRTEQASLAFLVEDIRIKSPDAWKERISKLIEEIKGKAEQGGVVEVANFLMELVGNAYSDSLRQAASETSDEELARKFLIIEGAFNDLRVFQRQAYGNGSIVDYGGVSVDFHPEWYSDK